jgi:hypothetical protein
MPAGDRRCAACRVTVLSRYNNDPLCAACHRASRDAAGIVPSWLWDSAPMRQALARIDLPAFVVILRSTTGLSQLELSNLVDGWSQSLVCRTERGLRESLYDIRKLLAFVDAIGMPRAALVPLILGHPDATLAGDGDRALEDVDTGDVDRRKFTTAAAGLAASLALPVPARVDRAHVRYLQATLARLKSWDHTVGGGALLPEALRHFTRARRMLDESDHTAAVGRELLVVAAELGNDTAWFAFDADNQPLARRLYEEAALLAESAGANEQRVHVYANMVQQCSYLAQQTGRPSFAREALRFGDRAADAVRHEPSPALHALVALRRSRAHAQVGDESAFRSTITTARRELDRGPHDADPAWMAFVRHSEITGAEAVGKAQLGAPAQAVRLYQDVLDDATRSPRDQAWYRARLAGALVQAGDLEQAIAHGLTVLPDLGTRLTSGRVLQNLRPVRAAANAAAAADFCDRFDAASRALRAV